MLGGQVTYTITALNNGPSDVTGAIVSDIFPATITSVAWTCSGIGGAICAASGSGNINDTSVDIPVGKSVTYLATATISTDASGSLVNTATVGSPLGVTEPDTGNNSATDVDSLVPMADLAVTKTDGQATAVAGTPLTYTVTVVNNGPGPVTGALVSDVLPTALSGATWTCAASAGGTCTANGTGNISDTVDLPSGGTATYTLSATLDSQATGSLINTAVVIAGGAVDPDLTNNSATDIDGIVVETDLDVTKSVNNFAVAPGDQVVYTLTVANDGPSHAAGAQVVDLFPVGLVNVSWTCQASAGATCPASGNGDINATVDIPSGGQVAFTATADVVAAPPALITNTATVTAATDPDNSNNSSDALVGDPIFRDGFESGDTTVWSRVVP